MQNFKIILLISMFFLLLSCKVSQTDKRDSDKELKAYFIKIFKSEAFYACITEGYQNDSIFSLMAKEDLFNTSDGFSYDLFDSAIKEGKKVGATIPTPYILIYDESMRGKKFISLNCLNYYESKALNSMAKKQFKVYLNNQKIFRKKLDSIAKINIKRKG